MLFKLRMSCLKNVFNARSSVSFSSSRDVARIVDFFFGCICIVCCVLLFCIIMLYFRYLLLLLFVMLFCLNLNVSSRVARFVSGCFKKFLKFFLLSVRCVLLCVGCVSIIFCIVIVVF